VEGHYTAAPARIYIYIYIIYGGRPRGTVGRTRRRRRRREENEGGEADVSKVEI
jgi:hypothetical protein